jgi:hypothetical protein
MKRLVSYRGFRGGAPLAEGDWKPFPPTAMTGQWTSDFCAETRASSLALDKEMDHAKADFTIFHTKRHDGTHLATWELVSFLTQAAEGYVEEHPGEWTVSPVYVQSEYGPDPDRPRWQDDYGAIFLKAATAATS